MKCWGSNTYGQLGDNSVNQRLTPVSVYNMTSSAIRLTAGLYHTCAVKSGAAYCWGRNSNGRLGNNSTTQSQVPVGVTGMSSGVSMITAGDSHSCLLKTSGEAYCWGFNSSGQLGDGTVIERLVPVAVGGGLAAGTSIAAGGNHTCALVSTGEVFCWGNNATGQLGIGSFVNKTTPQYVSQLGSGNTQITGGGDHTCAVVFRGGAKCWGKNTYGQLGNNGLTGQTTPDDVYNDLLMTFLSGGANHTCAIKGNYVYCWGYNSSGQLGIGTTANSKVPVMVTN